MLIEPDGLMTVPLGGNPLLDLKQGVVDSRDIRPVLPSRYATYKIRVRKLSEDYTSEFIGITVIARQAFLKQMNKRFICL